MLTVLPNDALTICNVMNIVLSLSLAGLIIEVFGVQVPMFKSLHFCSLGPPQFFFSKQIIK